MDKQTQREAARQIEDLPVEAEQSDEVKGGGMRKSGEVQFADFRKDPYKN
jgi:hypothetical protein